MKAMTHQHLVHIQDLSYAVQEKSILERITLTINSGDFLTIIGPNGAGKTTLLRLIIGMLKPSQGVIEKAADLRIGYVPQKLLLTGMLPIRVRDFLNTSPHEKEDIFDLTSIHRLWDTQLDRLSGGELQRVLIARALLQNPQLLILDEPNQGLDLQGQTSFYNLITNLKRKMGFAVLMVSHDLNFVHQASDYVLCLNTHICCHGKPDDIQQETAYQNLFPSLLKHYSHKHDHSHDDHLTPNENCKDHDHV